MSVVDPNPPVTKDDTLADDPWTDEPDGSPGEPDTTLVVGLLGKGDLSVDSANQSFGLEPTSNAEVDGANVETDGVYVSGYPLGSEEDDTTNPTTITSSTDTGAEQINYTGTTDGANAEATIVPDDTTAAYGQSDAEGDVPYLANQPGAKQPDIDDSGPDQFFGATQDTPPNVELDTLSFSGGAGTLAPNYGEQIVTSGTSEAQFGQPDDSPGELDTTNTSIPTAIPSNNGIPVAIPDSYVLTDIDTLYGYPGLTAGVGDSDPAAPTGVSWVFGPGKAIVSWSPADSTLVAPVQANLVLTTADSGVFGATGNEFYVVTAVNGEGETLASNEKSVNVAATTDSVTVSWAAVVGATGYNIYRGTSTGAEGHLVGTVSAPTLSFKDHGATGTAQSLPGTNTTGTAVVAPTVSGAVMATTGGALPGDETYYYVVTATNSYGETTASNEVFAGSFALLTPPVLNAPTQTLLDSGVFGAATEYFYVVTALNADGESLASNEVNHTIAATTTSISLSWAAVAEAVSYNIYRGTTTATEDHLVGNTSALTYKDHGAVGTSQSPPVDAPALTNTNEVTVSWSDVHGASGYNIYRGVRAGGEELLVGQVGSGATSYVDQGDPTGSAIPVAQTPPVINTTEQGAGVGPVREYIVFGYQVKNASYIPTTDANAAKYHHTVSAHAHGLVRDHADGTQTVEVLPTQVEIDHLTPGDFYFFRVMARNDTSESALSTVVGVTPPTAPATPYYYLSAGALDSTVVDIPAYAEPEGASLTDLTFTDSTGEDELGDANSGEDSTELARTGEEGEDRI